MLIVRQGRPFVYEIVFPDGLGNLVNLGPFNVEIYRYDDQAEKVLLLEQEVSADEDNIYLVIEEDVSGFPEGGLVHLVAHTPVGQRRDEIYVISEGGSLGADDPNFGVKFTRT